MRTAATKTTPRRKLRLMLWSVAGSSCSVLNGLATCLLDVADDERHHRPRRAESAATLRTWIQSHDRQ